MATTENPLGSRPLPQLLRSFAVPSILAMLVSSLYNIVDQIFIGQGVGYLGNAATNVAYPLTTICLAIALLIGIGAAANFNLNLGAGRQEAARRVVGAAVTMMVVLGVVYMVLVELFLPQLLRLFGGTDSVMPYALTYTRITALGMPLLIATNATSNLIRADGSPRFSMVCMLLGAVINTILDPTFIFLCHWGVAGAAWATVIGQAASCLLAVSYLPRFHNIHLTGEDFHFRPALWQRIASLGLSNSLNQVAITFVQIVLNNSLTFYGAQSVYGSEIPLATSGIVIKINAILLGIIVGISQGTQPIISFNYGAGEKGRVKSAIRFMTVSCILFTLFLWALLLLFPRFFIHLFNSEPELLEKGVPAMHIYFFGIFMMALQFAGQSTFVALGCSRQAVFFSLLRKAVIVIPLTLWLPTVAGLGTSGVFLAEPVSNFIGGSACFLTMLFTVRRMLKE